MRKHLLLYLVLLSVALTPVWMALAQEKKPPVREVVAGEEVIEAFIVAGDYSVVMELEAEFTSEGPQTSEQENVEIDWEAVEELVSLVVAYAEAVAPPPAPHTHTVQTPSPPSTLVEAPQWARDAVEAHFPTDEVERALRVMRCESGFVATARNSSDGTLGLMQIHPGWSTSWGYNYDAAGSKIPLVTYLGYTFEQLTDPYANTHVASVIWQNGGWGPWGCKG